MRRGQMELVGMIMVVVIIGFMLAFGLIYASKEVTEKQVHEGFGDNAIANNFVNALSKTHIEECSGGSARITYADLAKDCARNGDLRCDLGGSRDSCYMTSLISNQTLKNTLETWGMEYRYSVETDTMIYERNSSNCGPDDEKLEPGVNVITLYPETGAVTLNLDICSS